MIKDSDIELLKRLKEAARSRDLGLNSIEYYYALKHAIEELQNCSSEDANNVQKYDCSCN